MNVQEVFILADQTLKRVVDQIRDDQWSTIVPPDPMSGGNGELTLRETVNYIAYDVAWVPDMLAGKSMDEAGSTRFDGDLLGDDPKGNFGRFIEAACAAAGALDDPDRTVHCSYGDIPAREYFRDISGFHGLRAHDIARVIGVDSNLPRDLVQGLWDEISPHAEEWRAIGVFGPAVEVPADGDLQDRLLGITGRRP